MLGGIGSLLQTVIYTVYYNRTRYIDSGNCSSLSNRYYCSTQLFVTSISSDLREVQSLVLK